jgi:hypothetical protein
MASQCHSAARGLSGGTILLRWHGETSSARSHSGGLRLLWCRGVTRGAQDHSGGMRWLREQKVTHMTWRRVPVLVAWGNFSHIRSLMPLKWHKVTPTPRCVATLAAQVHSGDAWFHIDLGSLQRIEFFQTAWNHSIGASLLLLVFTLAA